MTVGFNFNNGKEILRRHDARSQGTQYGNVLRTLRRSTSRVANEGQLNARRTVGSAWSQAANRIAMGNGESVAVDRSVACDRQGAAPYQGRRTDARRVILKKITFCCEMRLVFTTKRGVNNSVKSDGVRPIFSTARGGAAFSTEFATSSRAFLLLFPKLNPIPGGRI